MSYPNPNPYAQQPQYGGGYGAPPPPHHGGYGGPGGYGAPPPHAQQPHYGGGPGGYGYNGQPGAGGYGQPSPSPAPYGAGPTGQQQYDQKRGTGEAGSYYDNAGSTQPGQAQQYDENGNPVGERGLGTMAMGGVAGFAANKMSGGKHSNLASIGGGALLAQGGKMAYEMFQKNHNKHGSSSHHQQGGFGGPPGQGPPPHGGKLGGALGSFFGKRDI